MCEATTIEVLSLNGLRAAAGCSNPIKIPFSGVSLFNTVGGTVPECVWHLLNLTTLHLTGNGLTGSVISQLPEHSSLTDLSLSHNQFSGAIPLHVQEVRRVDFSHNQFSGKYEENMIVWKNNYVDLEINRLSGQLSVSKLKNVSEVNILRGNMFSCETVPANDNFSEDYICGSEDLNESLLVFVVAIAVTCCVAMMTYLMNHLFAPIWSLKQNADSFIEPIMVLCDKFKMILRLFSVLLLLMLVSGAPIYVVRGTSEEAFSTHTNTYAWFWTLAYLRGIVPTAFIVCSWFVTVTACFCRIVLYPLVQDSEAHENGSSSQVKSHGLIVLSLFANGSIMITVNALYIYATQQPLSTAILFCMQLSLAVFRLGYSYSALPFLSQPVADPIANIRFRLRLLIVNNLVIPCLVTAFASPSCFEV